MATRNVTQSLPAVKPLFIDCPTCGGSGEGSGPYDCLTCGGDGEIHRNDPRAPMVTCAWCWGRVLACDAFHLDGADGPVCEDCKAQADAEVAAYNAVFPPAPPASADFAWLATRPNPMPNWQTFVGLTARDANGTPMVWRDNGERSGYYPAGGAA